MDDAMNTYRVTLTYPKSSKMPEYVEDIDATTKTEAILIARGLSYQEGWPEVPKKESAVIVKGDVE